MRNGYRAGEDKHVALARHDRQLEPRGGGERAGAGSCGVDGVIATGAPALLEQHCLDAPARRMLESEHAVPQIAHAASLAGAAQRRDQRVAVEPAFAVQRIATRCEIVGIEPGVACRKPRAIPQLDRDRVLALDRSPLLERLTALGSREIEIARLD